MILSEYSLTILIFVGAWIITALGFNIISGYAGQFHLGVAVYMGVGAYTSALLTTQLGFSFWIALPIALLLSALMGFITGLPALRVKDDFLVIITIGMAFVFESLLIYLPYFGGPVGIGGIPTPKLFGTFVSKETYLIIVFLMVTLCIILNYKLINSWMGLAWESIREDEMVTSLIGIDTRKFKLFAFTIGAAFCGCGGVFYAHYMTYITPYDFGFLPSIYIVVMVVFGGIGTIRGAIFGAAFMTIMPELFRFVSEYRNSIYGLLLVFMMLFEPQGILGNRSYVWEKIYFSWKSVTANPRGR
jgi:branched-chain amino acid transport system permease protein